MMCGLNLDKALTEVESRTKQVIFYFFFLFFPDARQRYNGA